MKKIFSILLAAAIMFSLIACSKPDVHDDVPDIIEEAAVKTVQTKQTRYESDGSISLWIEYEYDSDGNWTNGTWYKAEGSISKSVDYEYDSDGNLAKSIEKDADGLFMGTSEHTYNSDGSLRGRRDYDADGKGKFNMSYTYDAWGNLIGAVAGSTRTSYTHEYDSAGNPLSSIVTGGTTVHYEYDANSELIQKTYNKADGAIEIAEYANGNIIKDTFYLSDGSVEYWFTYEYDIIQ